MSSTTTSCEKNALLCENKDDKIPQDSIQVHKNINNYVNTSDKSKAQQKCWRAYQQCQSYKNLGKEYWHLPLGHIDQNLWDTISVDLIGP